MLLFYIRHGDPTYNPDQLTPLGQRQAEAVGRRLAVYGVDEIYSSTSNRAHQTAQPLSEMLKMDITELDWCNENHAWNELSVTDTDGKQKWLEQCPGMEIFFNSKEITELGQSWYDHPFFKASVKEGILRVNRCTDEFLAKFGYIHDRENGYYTATEENNEKRIALFAHAGFGSMFLSSLIDIPYPKYVSHFGIAHSSMTVIEFSSKAGKTVPRILQLSNDSHIYKENLPTNYNNYIRF